MRVGISVLAALTIGLAGCGLFSDDEDELADEAPTAEDLAPTRGVPIQAVREVEIGRTRDGFVITAYGTAPELGWALPRLRARRDGQPGQDGFVDYDFVASPPKIGLERGQGSLEARSLRADVLLKTSQLRDVAGIRVHALAGGLQLEF
ncbi:MAG: hypothetical protein AAFR17_03975 [Pseudomonadota bacterium]